MRKKLIALGITICILLAAPLAFAASISFTSGDFDQYPIGGDDEVSADGFSGNFDIEPGTSLIWEVNYGYFWAGDSDTGVYEFDAIRTFVVNGVSGNISQPFSVTIDSDTDTHTLNLYDGPTVFFDLGSLGILNVTPLGIGEPVVYDYYDDTRNEGPLNARFDLQPVPEPGTMMLLGSGLVGLMGYGRRRMKK